MRNFLFKGAENLNTPSLIFYREAIEHNIQKALKTAGSAKKLWPHMKTHKCPDILRMQMAHGITRFKCATIAEAELSASCGASDVLIAYPMVGPNQDRLIRLCKAFPEVAFWAIGDDFTQLRLLGEKARAAGLTIPLLIDVNPGLDRTGVPLDETESFYKTCCSLQGLSPRGLHCYDGQRMESDYTERKEAVLDYSHQLSEIRKHLLSGGYRFDTLVVGTTPSFPCFVEADLEKIMYYSPGTLILNDEGYTQRFPDMDYPPAAAVMTRVISRPKKGLFTLDLGVKGISTDTGPDRGTLTGFPHAHPILQNEEHWVFQMESGYEDQTPKIGDILFVIPRHICTTCALYDFAYVVSNRELSAKWRISARDRKITY